MSNQQLTVLSPSGLDGEKVCRDCGKSYPATTEYFHSRGNGKLNTYCKLCARTRALVHHYQNRDQRLVRLAEYRSGHQGKINEHIRQYYHQHPEKKRASDRAWRLANLERARAAGKQRYQANKQPYVARARRWAKANPAKARAYTRVKVLRRRGAPLDTEARSYVEIIKNDPCVYCGQYGDIVIDHIHPISRGGVSEWMNLAPACRSCNAAKTNHPLLFFLAERTTP